MYEFSTNMKSFYTKLPDCQLGNLHKDFNYHKLIYENCSAKTARWFISSFKLFLDWLMANYFELTPDSITENSLKSYFQQGSQEKGWSRNSLLSYYKGIKSF